MIARQKGDTAARPGAGDEFAYLLRVLLEGQGYDELAEFAASAAEQGWPAARKIVLQDAIAFRLVQLLHVQIDRKDVQALVGGINACIHEAEDSAPDLANRLLGFKQIANQVLRQPGEVPARLLLSDRKVFDLFRFVLSSPKGRTSDELREECAPDGGLDELIWPLLQLNYLRKIHSSGAPAFILDETIARMVEDHAAKHPVDREIMEEPAVVKLHVPIMPVFDLLTLSYAGSIGLDKQYGFDIRPMKTARLGNNWFQFDEVYLSSSATVHEDGEKRSECNLIVFPNNILTNGARENSLALYPTNTFVGYHWLVKPDPEFSKKSQKSFFGQDGHLRSGLCKTIKSLQNYVGRRQLIVLIDRPMADHVRYVGEISSLKIIPIHVEDNEERLSILAKETEHNDVLFSAITTCPMLATALPKDYAMLITFEDLYTSLRDHADATFDAFSRTMFQCFAYIGMSEEEWNKDLRSRDLVFRAFEMIRHTIRDVKDREGRFFEYISKLWAESEEGSELDQNATISAMRACYAWLSGPPEKQHTRSVETWPAFRDIGTMLFEHNQADHFHVNLRTQLLARQQEVYGAIERAFHWIKVQYGVAKANDARIKLRGWAEMGAVNHAFQALEALDRLRDRSL